MSALGMCSGRSSSFAKSHCLVYNIIVYSRWIYIKFSIEFCVVQLSFSFFRVIIDVVRNHCSTLIGFGHNYIVSFPELV